MRTIVVGAGAAGLWCAHHAVDRGPVTLVAPGAAEMAATAWAQGGVAAVTSPNDSFEAHARDTIEAGAGLCDPDAVRVLVEEAPIAVGQLASMGMAFDRTPPALEAGHSARRVLHAGGDASGRALHAFLARTIASDGRVERVDGRVRAVRTASGEAIGVTLEDGREIDGDRVVLATGGSCGVFGRRTGPDTSIGEGLAMAWDAGASLADMEFVQFHPTALAIPGQPAWLLTEALRGEGARLVDGRGRPFMARFHELGDLAPRDVVARAIVRIAEESGAPARLDARGVPDLATRFPSAVERCRELGLDLASTPVPVAPAAHYSMGGVLTDTWGRTSIPRLFACGEVACTGVHGANRLASNSLAEALVFGRRAALADDGPPLDAAGGSAPLGSDPVGALALGTIRDLADRFLGVRRNGPELEALLDRLTSRDRGGDRAATLVAWSIAAAASRREESRGGHLRVDFPTTRDRWRVRQAVGRSGWTTEPVRGDAPTWSAV